MGRQRDMTKLTGVSEMCANIIKKAIKLAVIIIEAFHSSPLHTKYYSAFFLQDYL
jgi:hypothetical protein